VKRIKYRVATRLIKIQNGEQATLHPIIEGGKENTKNSVGA
jgi:hypothetical protein